MNLKWKLKLTVELAPGESVAHDVTEWKRAEPVNLASLGLSMEEGKTILAGIQANMVTLQVERHRQTGRRCAKCGRRLRNKGHYQSTFRSVYGNVPVQVQRVTGCRDCGEIPVTPLFTRKSSTAPELRYLNANLAALLPFGKVAEFLNEVLPGTAATNAVTVRNRTRRVGGRLLREQAKPAKAVRPTPPQTVVIGLDGDYVRSRQQWERHFEITTGKLLGEDGECIRFALATNEYARGVRQIHHGLEALGLNEETQITVLSDGDAGLQTVQSEVAPNSEHVLDWFHMGMRFEHLFDAAKGIRQVPTAAHTCPSLVGWRLSSLEAFYQKGTRDRESFILPVAPWFQAVGAEQINDDVLMHERAVQLARVHGAGQSVDSAWRGPLTGRH